MLKAKKTITSKKPQISKKPVKEVLDKVEKPIEERKQDVYFEAVGRRKTATARVRIFAKKGVNFSDESGNSKMEFDDFTINEKPINNYFPSFELQQIVGVAFEKMNCLGKFFVSVRVKGGGFHSQAEAVRHGISRALVLFNQDFRRRLKKSGFLTRDPRMRERKKFGLKRARRAPQWQKR